MKPAILCSKSPLPEELNLGGEFVCGESPGIRAVNEVVSEVAQTDIPILIIGESGTGKEVYARVIHRLSRAAKLPARKLDCGMGNDGQVVAELHKVFRPMEEQEELGSIFLDRIDELDTAAQKILLTEITRSEWGQDFGPARYRLISATTKNMDREVEAGEFRRELYFRLNGACLQLPPLRERKEDLEALTQFFLEKHSKELGKAAPTLSSASLQVLSSYWWPGNIRELENVTRKMVAVGNMESVLLEMRTTRLQAPAATNSSASSLKIAAKAASRERERQLILDALQRTKWNRKQAARELQISYKSLLYKIKQIETPEPLLQERGGK